MEQVTRQCVGIDIAKKSFTACLCRLSPQAGLWFSQVTTFENSTRGFNQLLKWARKQAAPSLPLAFAMEATGNYYEPLAYHLHKLKQAASVVLPNKVKHFGKSLNIKSKTDNIDTKVIAQLGAERQLTAWQPPAPVFKALRELTRHCTDLKRERTVLSNRLSALLSAHEPQGFALIDNARQLASYAGFDVVERESGTSVRGKTRISKKGNGRIRAALYFPAMVASRHNAPLRTAYQRINAGKASKMVGMVSLQRKLLLLIYSMWKSNTVFQDKPLSSGDQERKPLLRHKDEVFENKVGRPPGLPTQDELPSDLSSEALLRQ